MLGILGSGFGLYGYFPAAYVFFDSNIALLEKSKDLFLEKFGANFSLGNIAWYKDKNSLFASCDSLIFAIPPEHQFIQVLDALKKANIKNFFLEKPLAPTPEKSILLFNLLSSSNKNFSIAYLFRYTDWAIVFRNHFLLSNKKICKIKIFWAFHAHHYKNNLNNWKADAGQGGGALRFYGIHLIALLFEFGYSDIIASHTAGHSENDVQTWKATFCGNDLPTCEVLVNTVSLENKFYISSETNNEKVLVVDLETPFSIHNPNGVEFSDPRSKIIENMFRLSGEVDYQLYSGINYLWLKIENKNTHMIV
jgi:predicted dehydrogenase